MNNIQNNYQLNRVTNPKILWIVNIVVILLFIIGLSYFGYQQFKQETQYSLAYPNALTRPNRFLSFQPRLTNSSLNPITSSTPMEFRLFDSGPSIIGGTELWNSGACSVTPDQDGIVNVSLGNDCGSEIPSSVFSENDEVWLEVTVDGETLNPRQLLNAVAYSLNAETLQGYPPAAAATANTVLIMDNNGDVVLGNTAPTLRATGTSFTIEAQTLTLQTASGSDGDIVLISDDQGNIRLDSNSGIIQLNEDTITSALVNVGASTTIHASLNLGTGVAPTSPTIGDMYSDGNALYFYGSGGWEDLTDTGGGGPWTDGGTYLYPTAAENLGNSTSGGTNKLAGAYLADNAPLFFGTDNDISALFNGTNFVFTAGANTYTLNGSSGTFWTSGNDGSGSGLDADTVDGVSSGSFLRSDTSDNYTSGTLIFDVFTSLSMASGSSLVGDNGSTIDINGNISIADTNIALDGASTNLTTTGDFSINSTALFAQKSNDFIGINNTSPLARLDVGGDIYLTGGISTYRTSVSAGTVEATQFCTGDGETNCVTDFAAISGGSSIWTDGGTYAYLTNNETIGNSTSAGANKATGLYLSDNSPVVFGNDNDFQARFNGTNLVITDGTNTLLTLNDAGTTGALSTGTVTTTGNITAGGDLTITGDDIFMATNISGYLLVADGTNYNPVAISGDIALSSAGLTTIQANSVALGTDTTGNYVGDVSSGNGIGITGTPGEGYTETVALGDLTANWIQSGAFDILLANGSSELQIMESTGATFYGTLDVGDLSGNATYTFSGASGTVWTTANDGSGSTLDADTLDGNDESAFFKLADNETVTGIPAFNGGTSGVSAPFTVDSNFLVTNLNADALDGIDSGSFLRSDASDNYTSGTLTWNSGTGLTMASGSTFTGGAGSTVDINGDLAIADTSIALDGASTNFAVTGNFSINTDDLFVQKSDGNVGIGTTNPLAPLDVAGDIYLTSGLSTFRTAVSDGTIEATKFCTGDGETNCITDFAALSSGSSIWTDAGTYIHPTNSEVLGNSTSAGANKLAGAYFSDNSPVVFGTDNDFQTSFNGTNLVFTDGTNTLLTLNDAGTTGALSTGTVTTTGNITAGGDLTITGDDLFMATNTSGFLLVADGTNYNPVAMSGDLNISSTGLTTVQANAVALGTDTTGNYVGDVTAGNGIGVTGTPGEGYTETIALGALTADWNQTGAFDVILANAASEIQILESTGATFYGTIDMGDLTANATYTFAGASGTIWTSGNDGTASTLDADLLDGISEGSFLRSDTTDNYTSGTLTWNSGTTLALASGSTLNANSGSTVDINGDLAIADTDIAFDGASTNLDSTGNFSINTNDLFINKSSGFVGIGTTSPGSLLDVQGSISGSNQAGGSFLTTYSGTTAGYGIANNITTANSSTLGTVATQYNILNLTGTAATTTAFGVQNILNLNGTSNATDAYVYYADANDASSGAYTNLYGMYVDDLATSSNGSYAFYQIGSDDRNYFAGTVGIGTTLPTGTNKLQVSGGDFRVDRGTSTNSITRTFTLGGAQQSDGTVFANIDFTNYKPSADYTAFRISAVDPSGTDGGELHFFGNNRFHQLQTFC